MGADDLEQAAGAAVVESGMIVPGESGVPSPQSIVASKALAVCEVSESVKKSTGPAKSCPAVAETVGCGLAGLRPTTVADAAGANQIWARSPCV